MCFRRHGSCSIEVVRVYEDDNLKHEAVLRCDFNLLICGWSNAPDYDECWSPDCFQTVSTKDPESSGPCKPDNWKSFAAKWKRSQLRKV
jgi:hypothetical protein